MTVYLHDISNHAVQRYCERIRPGAERADLMACFQAAGSPAIKRKRKTQMVMTGCCVLVFTHGTLVTVLTRDQLRRSGKSVENDKAAENV